MRLLDPLDVDMLSRALPDRYAGLPIVAAYTGMRWGELAGLRVADINLLRRRLTIRSSLVEAAGELPQLGPTKSAASERTISLPRVVVDTIASHLSRYPPVEGVIWTTEKGEFLRRGSFSRIWRKAVSESVGQPCRIHDLRHTHAAWLIAAGEHPEDHSDPPRTLLDPGHDGPVRPFDGRPGRPHGRPPRRHCPVCARSR